MLPCCLFHCSFDGVLHCGVYLGFFISVKNQWSSSLARQFFKGYIYSLNFRSFSKTNFGWVVLKKRGVPECCKIAPWEVVLVFAGPNSTKGRFVCSLLWIIIIVRVFFFFFPPVSARHLWWTSMSTRNSATSTRQPLVQIFWQKKSWLTTD